MSCRLNCPTCHNTFFKISNMSIQSLRNKESLKPASSSASRKLPKSTSSELDTVLRCNLHLEKENNFLRTEIHDLALKNENLLEALNKNRKRFEGDFNKLQEDIRVNEKQLIENSRKCLEQQKTFADEIKKLKQENDDLKKQRKGIETELTEKLKSLESEIKIMKLDNDNLRSHNKENDDKCIKYKTKLRHAVKIVNDLNQIVAQYEIKPQIVCEMTQTDWATPSEQPNVLDCSPCGDPRYKRNLNSENLLLSDIFFKPKSFLDSEIDLFSAKSKSRSSSRSKS